MTNNEASVLNISRLLTPERQGNLLAFVHLAYVVEKSACRTLEAYTRKPQEYSRRNNSQRSKK